MLEKIQAFLEKYEYINLIYLSFALLVVYQIIKFLIIRKIDSSTESSPEDKILSKRRVKDYGRFVLLIAIFSLWFAQLQTVFVSLIAFAAAIVLAFKEVIMCTTGGMLIRFNKHFSIGDRIEVDGTRGFVLEKKIMTTRVLELGPEKNSQQTTGDIITIPNSIFLSKSAVNQSYFQNFSIRSFTFSPIDKKEIEKSEELLLEIANSICGEYINRAKQSISNFCKKEGLIIPTIEPRIKLLLSEDNEAKLLLKMPVDNKKIADIEQAIFREYYKNLVKSWDKKNYQDS